MDVAYSTNRVPIRLTDERWSHIVEAHDDMFEYYDDCLRAIEQPDFVLKGMRGTLRAVRSYGSNRYLLVTYREFGRHDGFLITAYFVSRINRRNIVWQR